LTWTSESASIRERHFELEEPPARLRTKDGALELKTRALNSADTEAVRRRRGNGKPLLTVLKAAQSQFCEGRVPNEEAWRRAEPFREAGAARVRDLSHDEARRLVNAKEPGLRQMVQAALLPDVGATPQLGHAVTVRPRFRYSTRRP
jgi:hypothetical protein